MGSSIKPLNRRSNHAQSMQRMEHDAGVPRQDVETVIRGCEIIGLASGDDVLKEEELYHFWARVRLPASMGSSEVRVRLGHTDHELFGFLGNEATLIGRACRIQSRGSSTTEIELGTCYIESDRNVSHGNSAAHTRSFNPVGLAAGIMKADITKEIKYMTQSFEKIGPRR